MSVRILATGSALLGILLATPLGVSGQVPAGRPVDLKIKTIRQQQVEAPSYGGNNTDLGGRPATLWRKWLKIEVQFESDSEWSDDVQLKYYVLIGKGKETKLLTGDVTHFNVAKGSQHYSVMFVQPNTLKRFGNGQIEAVAVQLFYQNRLLDQLSDPPSSRRWWEAYTPALGYLLAPQDTPWAPIAHERFEAVKTSRP